MKKESFIRLVLMITAMLYVACYNQTKKVDDPAMIKAAADTKALKLMQQNCFSCHNPDIGVEKRLAPPMFMVRNHYFDSIIKKEEFVNKIVTWAGNPTMELSIMPGAVRKFGLMPRQQFKEEELKIIAAYIYENDIESDTWYIKYDAFKKASQPKPEI